MDVFFFSSRRRHTRYIGDWSSDVCSSDLLACPVIRRSSGITSASRLRMPLISVRSQFMSWESMTSISAEKSRTRSEERRVGKECRSRRELDNEKERARKEERLA